MANTLYKTTVRELEAVLPPRVVSQSLQEGLSAVAKNADTLSYRDAESIFQNRVLPRLTLLLGAARAEAARQEILERLSKLPDESELPALDLGAQAQALRELQDALKPFNIYFDWRETQELRAQLLLLETENAAERNAGALVAAAQAQLGVLRQKLDDQLSVQARELVVLEAALENSAILRSPKVRRLGQLVNLVRGTQEAHRLAPAEVERAHKLAGDLRAELRVDEAARELHALEEGFSTLLTLESTLAERFAAYRQTADTPSGETLAAFSRELETTQEALRRELQREFQESRSVHARRSQHQNPELTQLLTLSLTILETTLPPADDVQRLRDLLRTDTGGIGTAGDTGADQADHRPKTEADGYYDQPSEAGKDPEAFFRAMQRALGHTHSLSDLTSGWDVQKPQVEQAQSIDFAARVAAAESAAATLGTLNSEAAADLRERVQKLRAREGPIERVLPERRAELEATLQETEALISSLRQEADATRSVAAQLIREDAFNDIFGLFSVPALKSAVPNMPKAVASADLQDWLERQLTYEGVEGLALFIGADTLVAGTLPTDADALHRAANVAKSYADTPGTDHEQGDATTLRVETSGHTLVTFWLGRARSLVLVSRAQGDAARQRLEAALPELVTLLA